MAFNLRQVAIAAFYCILLSWIYLTEIVEFWEYMGFISQFSTFGLVLSLASTVLVAAITPDRRDVRSILLSSALYVFYIPSIIYVSYSPVKAASYGSIFILVGCVFAFSSLKLQAFQILPLSERHILTFVLAVIVVALAIQAYYGGLDNFNLDIERVYEFRQDTATDMPAIFGYFYSNVASVLVPLALVLALRGGNYGLALVSLIGSIILFGMSHHKSVLFGPPTVALLYIFFQRMHRNYIIGVALLSIPIIGLLELVVVRELLESSEAAYFNSLIVRRVLFVPAMLDGLYVQYFDANAKYFWSTSRIAFWASENFYGVTPPFLIGHEYFADVDTSANTGVIGSGFANAGLIGVAIYSSALGLLIALLNAYGHRIGHPLAAAASFATIFNILTSTDMMTAVLTHGLLLLIILLSLFSAKEEGVPTPTLQLA